MKATKRVISLILAAVLLVGVMAVTVSAKGEIKSGVGFVKASALRLRSGPSTSNSILATAYKGDVVVVLEKVGSWYKVIFNLKEGYMSGEYLTVKERENMELGYGSVNAYCVNLRSKPTTSSSVVAQVAEGEKLYTIGFNCGWYKVLYKDQYAYVRSDLLNLTEYPYENAASTNSPKYFRNGDPISAASQKTSAGQKLADKALQYLGVPYVWGGTSPSGFDCSGLVQYVMNACGYSISRTADKQYNHGTSVSKSNLRVGDLVFFANTYTSGISHIGIYIGNNQFVHAGGSQVKITSMDDSYYSAHYYGARRVV